MLSSRMLIDSASLPEQMSVPVNGPILVRVGKIFCCFSNRMCLRKFYALDNKA